MSHLPPAPPPPPLPSGFRPPSPASISIPTPRFVESKGPAGAFLVELMVFNGSPFNNHWAYFVQSSSNPSVGAVLHSTGDVRNGFRFEIKRNYELNTTDPDSRPTWMIPLQWVDGRYFDEQAMLNNGVCKFDNVPVCPFEESVHKVKAPEKSLNTSEESVSRKFLLLTR